MENFIHWLFTNFTGLYDTLAGMTVATIDGILVNWGDGTALENMDFNLLLFSESPILSTNLYNFLLIFFGIFYTTIFIVCVYKIIKKVFVKITGWKKW